MKHVLKGLIGLVVIAVFCIAIGSSPTKLNSWEEAPASGPSIPVSLSIDVLGINAPVEQVGVTDRFVMAVPSTAESVGWYRFGTHPGDVGSAVLAGHVNWTGRSNAVFTDLHMIREGDIIDVKNNYGSTDHFIVRNIKRYDATADASEVFSSDDGKTRLNLITCDGPWNSLLGTHSSRLVVFSEKI